jgi:hypothetical protein
MITEKLQAIAARMEGRGKAWAARFARKAGLWHQGFNAYAVDEKELRFLDRADTYKPTIGWVGCSGPIVLTSGWGGWAEAEEDELASEGCYRCPWCNAYTIPNEEDEGLYCRECDELITERRKQA